MPSSQQDWGFVGPAYTAAMPFQDRQVLVNYYVEIDKTQGAKTPTALLGCPGLIKVASVIDEFNDLITDLGEDLITENFDFLVWK